jgi:hypothetical protein
MNLKTFNDQFTDLERELLKEGQPSTLPKTWQTAPLFNYECQYSREIELLKNAPKDTEFRLPFDVLRLAVTERSDRGRYRADYVIDARDIDRVSALIVVKDLMQEWPDAHLWRQLMPLAFSLIDLRWNERDPRDNSTVLYAAAFRFAGTWIHNRHYNEVERAMLTRMREHYMNGAVDAMAAFALDAMSPTAHIAQVLPAQPGRSVQWTQQRTHYTLISHGHPANKPTVKLGQRVADDEQGELSRMAHNRRAHFRTLRHERYRFARGQRVFVRAAWIGPKEWRDEGGRQIYRILEPVT